MDKCYPLLQDFKFVVRKMLVVKNRQQVQESVVEVATNTSGP